MPDGLRKQERAVEQCGYDGRKDQLGSGKCRVPRGDRIVRQHQREHRQGHEHGKVGARRLGLVTLHRVIDGRHDQADAHQPATHDHDHREDRVAHQRRVRISMEHHRNNDGHLDGCDRNGQDQGPVGLSEPVAHHFSEEQGAKHRAGEHSRAEHGKGKSRPGAVGKGHRGQHADGDDQKSRRREEERIQRRP